MKIVERLLFTLVLLTIAVASAAGDSRTVVGLVEEVKITPGGLTL